MTSSLWLIGRWKKIFWD